MVTLGLQVRLEARPGKEKELEEFLHAQLSFAIGEPATIAWFVIKLAPGIFGLFDAFADESGRKAHLEGEIAKTLEGDVGRNLLAKPPTVEFFNILAAKLPGNGEVPDSLG